MSLCASTAHAQMRISNPNARPRVAGAACMGFGQKYAVGGSLDNPVLTAYPTITQVEANGPAAEAGIALGDSVVSVNGKDAMTTRGVLGSSNYSVGQSLDLKVKRAASLLDLRLVVGQYVDNSAASLTYDSTGRGASPLRCGPAAKDKASGK